MKNKKRYLIFWIGVLILSIFMAVSCRAQTTDKNTPIGMSHLKDETTGCGSGQIGNQNDTVQVVMLVCDTSSHYDYVWGIDFGDNTDSIWRMKIIDTVSKYDSYYAHWIKGYSVRELHNTSEGQIDPGICPSCWHNYWKHIKLLDSRKNEISRNIIVWDFKEIEP